MTTETPSATSDQPIPAEVPVPADRPAPADPPTPTDPRAASASAGTDAEGAVSLWLVYGSLLLCMGIAGLLTSGRLVEIAERQPLGSVRRLLLLGAAGGVDALAQAAALDRPARLVDAALGRSGPAGPASGSAASGSPGEATPGRIAIATGMWVTLTPGPGEATPRAWTYFPTPGPSPTPTRPALRAISPDAKLTVLVVGDSFAQPLGYELTNFGARDGLVDVAIDSRISTGIARPDYFDWPAQLAGVAAGAPPPEAVVLFMGANDDQNMVTEDGVVQLTTPEWRAEYRRRVSLIADAFADRGTLLYWVGLPVMRDPFENQVAMDINGALADEAASRPWLRFVDIWETFGGADGGFAAYLPNASGDMEQVRQNDGVHLTRTGSDHVAALVYEALHRDWDLTPPTPTPEPTPTEPPTEPPTEIPAELPPIQTPPAFP